MQTEWKTVQSDQGLHCLPDLSENLDNYGRQNTKSG